ncbi:GNAT family N-acetyltransferase [Sulfitobacter sp. G21635-S1]|uniref:GNAT family N-acetyltransferase n=1 Tax=Sulfitobacter sp. G21635-S1 TaxID=3014043 RepID=UPI0022AF7DDD|nr:GNAT family N-acetyltransferase [Sulfitobacter sp. G21635-S1]MCZ4259092.1 GNAT family N-acetyltransferase [Sulfitobacter sp. G21635-S1]
MLQRQENAEITPPVVGYESMTGERNKKGRETNPSSEDIGALQSEIDKLNRELRAFVAVALQHGLRDYCEARHPKLTEELEKFYAHSPLRAKQKYETIISRISNVPGLQGTPGDTAERIYYRNAQDNVAYIEHALKRKRFVLGGIWVAPHYRGKGLAHKILRVLVEAADEADLSIELYHEPFGEEGLRVNELEAFYNRHGFTMHNTAPGGMVRFPQSPLDLYVGK